MRRNLDNREITFTFEDGDLIRTVVERLPEDQAGPPRSYQHCCCEKVFESVAHALNDVPMEGQGITQRRIVQDEQLPFTQVDVALAFLRCWGIVDVRRRRYYPASTTMFEDAMVEFLAQRDGVHPRVTGISGE